MTKKNVYKRVIKIYYPALMLFLVFTFANNLLIGVIQNCSLDLLMYNFIWLFLVIQTTFAYVRIKEIEPDADLHFITQQGKKHGLEAKMDWLELNHFDLIITPDAGSYDKEQMERLIELGSEILSLD